MTPQVCSLVASTIKGGIGFKGRLPWRIPEDMKHYEHVSRFYERGGSESRNGIVMGRRTWESLPKTFRPLPDRKTCIISSTIQQTPKKDFEVAPDLEAALNKLKNDCNCIFISGGAALYDEAHRKGLVDRVFWTRVCGPDIQTDTKIDTQTILRGYDVLAVTKTKSVGDYTYDFLVLDRKGTDLPPPKASDFPSVDESCLRTSELRSTMPNMMSEFPKLAMSGHEEFQYLNIMETIIKEGLQTDDRTGVGTFMKWGAMMRFDLRDSFPLLTTKRVYWKGVVEELLWFLQGKTDGNYLSERDVHIWDANGTKEFLEKRGLGHRRAGDLGPIYGFQWRHFGAEYKTCDDDYSGKGVDQVQEVINTILNEPESRRIILTAWNPAALKEMALPPCHMMCQFFVDPKLKELSCTLYQRSADWGLGIPFNIASYSLLTMIIAQLTGLRAREFVHVVGNAHVYKNHVEPLKAQLKRLPRPFPRVMIDKSPKTVDEYRPEHFKLIGYEPWPAVKMEMAV